MKVWITKHALTIGILEVDCQVIKDCPAMIRYNERQYAHGEGRQWFRDTAPALFKAEEMRKAKIASLKKAIEKLQKMKIGIVK